MAKNSLASLAWRNLWRNRRRTGIMLGAISVGVWAMIFMTALMRGMVDQMVEDGIDALPGHVQVHQPAYRDDPNIEPAFTLALGSVHQRQRGGVVGVNSKHAGSNLRGIEDLIAFVIDQLDSCRVAGE